MNEPPEKTALFKALNLLSPVGMTLPNHLRKISGCFCRPSVEPTKMTPCPPTAALMFEYAASLSNCASTPARNFLSCSGIPSRSNVRFTSAGTSSHERFGAVPWDR